MNAGRNESEPATAQALTQACVRILRGNPTLEEVAALAAALAARAHTAGAASAGQEPHPDAGPADRTPRTRWRHPADRFRAPGAWAS
ncbi:MULTISPECIES: acyl-CoA carboxylase epsilon subunit [unclassified Streptomyces]|uniref:acyl-CoA carboxylase epsilon subunit n=1 Tax=unclassified Streptomyces TaxID=2593676 RepID=UPI0029A1507A|nr:acyl-CoA carboxylase epsilon subunit [Streptomyces sp. FL07-04A]MDX3580132.1 acyl-CoA carboxylase epsilon subunit [Streptomyces sp. FL07-04A]